MKPSLRPLLCCITLALAGPALAADAYPSRLVRIVVNAATGGLLDVQTRLVAQEMSKNLNQSVIVENRTGADGLIGIRFVKTAPADGYTVLSSANTFAQNPALKVDVGYDVSKDFVGIGMIAQSPLLMITAASHAEKTLADVINRAKAEPGKMTYASGGVGTSTHMAAALFLSAAGVQMLHVPYKGNAAAQPDVLGGRININFDGANTVIPHAKAGRLRIFGITTGKRSPAFADLPTLAEQGLSGYDFAVYSGLIAAAATPKELIERLGQSLRAAVKSDAARDRFTRDGSDAGTLTPDEFTTFLRDDEKRTIKVAQDLGLKQ